MMNFDTARSLANAAISEAKTMGIAIALSVVDNGGHLIYFARMDGVSFMAVEVTRRKAVTAAMFRMPTHALTIIASHDAALADDLAKSADVCMVAGGAPVQQDGQVVGAIGIAGGRSEQDKAIAEKALLTLVAA